MINLVILCSNCFACRHFRRQEIQKQWLQFGIIPNLASEVGCFSIITSMQIPHVLSFDFAIAKASSISFSCWLMQTWRQKHIKGEIEFSLSIKSLPQLTCLWAFLWPSCVGWSIGLQHRSQISPWRLEQSSLYRHSPYEWSRKDYYQ